MSESIAELDERLEEEGQQLPGYENLTSIKGIGSLSATVLLTVIGKISDFADENKLAAYLGLVPRIANSNESERSGRITKQGKDYLRALLFQGARSAILTAHRRHNRLSRWIVQLQARVACKELSRRRLCPGKTDNSHMPARPES